MKGLSAREIHQVLVDILGAEPVGYFGMTLCFRTAKFPGQSEEAPAEADLMSTE
jgi:hypothetical protein